MKDYGLYLLFSKSLGRSLIVGSRLSEHLGEHEWKLDFEQGKIRFGEENYPFQFLGTESDNGTWKWAWDNVNGFDEGLLNLAYEIKAYGEDKGIRALKTANLETDENCNGLVLASVATYLSKTPYAYYLCYHEKGVAVIALEALPEAFFKALDFSEVASFLIEALQTYEVDHQAFCEGLLEFLKVPYKKQEMALIADFKEGAMSLVFDSYGHLSELDFSSY